MNTLIKQKKPNQLMTIATLKLRCSILNQKLRSKKLEIWESDKGWTVIVLVSLLSCNATNSHSLNIYSRRDTCLAKSWLSFLENTLVCDTQVKDKAA